MYTISIDGNSAEEKPSAVLHELKPETEGNTLPQHSWYMPTDGYGQLNVLQYESMRTPFAETPPSSQQWQIFFRPPSCPPPSPWIYGQVTARLENGQYQVRTKERKTEMAVALPKETFFTTCAAQRGTEMATWMRIQTVSKAKKDNREQRIHQGKIFQQKSARQRTPEDGSQHLCGYLAIARQKRLNQPNLSTEDFARLTKTRKGVSAEEFENARDTISKSLSENKKKIAISMKHPHWTQEETVLYLEGRSHDISKLKRDMFSCPLDSRLGGENACDLIALALGEQKDVHLLIEISPDITLFHPNGSTDTVTLSACDPKQTDYVIEHVWQGTHYEAHTKHHKNPPTTTQRPNPQLLHHQFPLKPARQRTNNRGPKKEASGLRSEGSLPMLTS